MTGHEHYREAEQLIEEVERVTETKWVMENLAAAQVHATLALTAATIDTANVPANVGWTSAVSS